MEFLEASEWLLRPGVGRIAAKSGSRARHLSRKPDLGECALFTLPHHHHQVVHDMDASYRTKLSTRLCWSDSQFPSQFTSCVPPYGSSCRLSSQHIHRFHKQEDQADELQYLQGYFQQPQNPFFLLVTYPGLSVPDHSTFARAFHSLVCTRMCSSMIEQFCIHKCQNPVKTRLIFLPIQMISSIHDASPQSAYRS